MGFTVPYCRIEARGSTLINAARDVAEQVGTGASDLSLINTSIKSAVRKLKDLGPVKHTFLDLT